MIIHPLAMFDHGMYDTTMKDHRFGKTQVLSMLFYVCQLKPESIHRDGLFFAHARASQNPLSGRAIC